ncbi:MAG: methylated-DNA--[protein]-cysteine S-methyltransferase [Dehalococcoidia bacterium]|nr:methylated-DNA--[protein]-cysteine S-methyltransferase [Dehalococcoidia bacterium]
MVAVLLSIVVVETALGWAGVALSPGGIRHATLFHASRTSCEAELMAAGAEVVESGPRAEEIARLLTGYARGEGALLDEYPVDLPPCTPLQRSVWLALRHVPYGQTRSYGWLANEVGAPGKARPVGSINGANPIPLWLPCHRIIGADGSLVGYGGGLEMKRQLLELEGALPRSMFG